MNWLKMLAIAGMNGGGSGGSGGGVSPEEVTTIVKEQFPGGVGYSEAVEVEIFKSDTPLNYYYQTGVATLPAAYDIRVGQRFIGIFDGVRYEGVAAKGVEMTGIAYDPEAVIVLFSADTYIALTSHPETNQLYLRHHTNTTPTTVILSVIEEKTSTIDPKYLPKGGFGYSEIGEMELYRNENASEIYWSYNMTESLFEGPLIIGQTYTGIFDGQKFEATATSGEEAGGPPGSVIALFYYNEEEMYEVALANMEDGKVFLMWNAPNLLNTSRPESSIIISTIGEKITTIDPKFLPGRTLRVRVKWDESGYVADKTFEEICDAYKNGMIVEAGSSESEEWIDIHRLSTIDRSAGEIIFSRTEAWDGSDMGFSTIIVYEDGTAMVDNNSINSLIDTKLGVIENGTY